MIKRVLLTSLALVFFSWGAWSLYRMLFVPNEYAFSDWIVSIGLQVITGIVLLGWSLDQKK